MGRILETVIEAIVRVLIYLASVVIRIAKAILVAFVVYLAARVVDLFAQRLYSKK